MGVQPSPSVPKRPAALHDHAIDNLRFIRHTMERAASFTAVPGWGGVAMGLSALPAAYVAGLQVTRQRWLVVWLLESALAFTIGMFAMWRKARASRVPIWSAPARKFAFSFAPPVFAGGVLTAALARADAFHLIPGMWLCLYGTAVMTGGAFSARVVPAMGAAFLAAGTMALFTSPGLSDVWLGLGFGGLHVFFGLVIARRHGG